MPIASDSSRLQFCRPSYPSSGPTPAVCFGALIQKLWTTASGSISAQGQLLPIANDSYGVINLVSLTRVDWLQLAFLVRSQNHVSRFFSNHDGGRVGIT